MNWHFVNLVNQGYPEYAYPLDGSTPWQGPYPPPLHYQQNQWEASITTNNSQVRMPEHTRCVLIRIGRHVYY